MTTVAIDRDDTLVDAKTQEWLPDAEAALRELLRLGCKVVIHTCRANWPEGLASIEAKLAGSRLVGPRISIHTAAGKPRADVYIDNQAITFTGDWATPLAVFRDEANQRAAANLARASSPQMLAHRGDLLRPR